MDDTGVRTPDPEEHDDADDGGIGFPLPDATIDATGTFTPAYYQALAGKKVAALRGVVAYNLVDALKQYAAVKQEQDEAPAPSAEAEAAEEKEEPPVKLYGMALLKEMTRDELVEEMLSHQRDVFAELDRQELIQAVMSMRIGVYKRRLLTEAGLEGGWSLPFGD